MNISILGCGWLGLPLAVQLIKKGHIVKGSTITPHKKSDLKKIGIQPYLIDADEPQSFVQDFFDSEVLIITLPFRRSFENPQVYFDQCKSVIDRINKSPILWVIFTSSTLVYPNSGQIATESDVLKGWSKRAEVLLACENLFLSNPNFDGTVIRLGGLYGPGRLPGRFLAGKKDIEGPDNPVNLIHLDDCIGIIEAVIDRHQVGEIFNAVSPGHPTKKAYYSQCARSLGLAPPTFNYSTKILYKEVSAKKVCENLGYSFSYPDPVAIQK